MGPASFLSLPPFLLCLLQCLPCHGGQCLSGTINQNKPPLSLKLLLWGYIVRAIEKQLIQDFSLLRKGVNGNCDGKTSTCRERVLADGDDIGNLSYCLLNIMMSYILVFVYINYSK